MQMSELRLLIAGCGSIGKRHAQVLRELGVRQMAACDPFVQSHAAFLEIVPDCTMYTDYAAALAEYRPDAVFILTPTAMHLQMARQAIEAGCHVFIEKPLANTPEGVEALEALARARDRKVMVGFCFRYHEVLRKAKALLRQGEIGRLISVRALMGEPFYEIQPNYMNMYYSRYSGCFELVHDVDLAIWFADQPIASVCGYYGSYSDMGMQSPDTAEMLIKFEDRCMANVHLDFFQSPRRRQIDLIGMEGVITVEFASWDEATLSVYSRKDRQWRRETFPTARNDMFRDEDRDFLNAVCGDAPVECTIAEAVKSLKAVSAVYQMPKI